MIVCALTALVLVDFKLTICVWRLALKRRSPPNSKQIFSILRSAITIVFHPLISHADFCACGAHFKLPKQKIEQYARLTWGLQASPNQVLSRHCGRACSTSQEKHLFMNPHGKVRARGILNNPLTNWHHDSWCRWAHLYSPYFRLRRSRATASERAMVRANSRL